MKISLVFCWVDELPIFVPNLAAVCSMAINQEFLCRFISLETKLIGNDPQP